MQVHNLKKIIRALLWVISAVVIIIIIGTIIGLRSGQTKPLDNADSVSLVFDQEIFADLGRLRLQTQDTPPVSIILTPVLEYPAEDTAAREELVKKKEQLQAVCTRWFSHHTAEDIRTLGAAGVKRELLAIFNKELSMQVLEKIYFKEYILLP